MEISVREQEQLLELKKNFEEQDKIAQTYMEQGYNPMISIVMAGDHLSRKRADDLVEKGESVRDASVQIGSYSRFDWVVEQYYTGNISTAELAEWICELWRGADPDDTNPDYISVWEDCQEEFGEMLYDEKKFPLELLDESGLVTVYRGQLNTDDPVGLSWTLSKDIARKFAHGAALRTYQDGYLGTAKVYYGSILAYISGRNEEEVIIPPHYFENEEVSWEFVKADGKKG